MLNEAVPLIRHLTRQDAIGVTGCSFGAYHAMALALRNPYTFTSCVTMGGAFDVSQFLDGYFDEDCYFLNPPSFLPGLADPYYLDQFRRNKWVLVTGDHDICRAPNEQFSALLQAKGIHHSLHVWNDSKHDWPYWRPMAAWPTCPIILRIEWLRREEDWRPLRHGEHVPRGAGRAHQRR